MNQKNSNKEVCTAAQIHQKLIDAGIKKASGNININFMGISTLVKEASAVGDLFQEWLGSWFDENNIDVDGNIYTQEPPDFYIIPQDKTKGLLEIKTFVDGRSPAFDVANFDAYCDSLRTKAYRLDADYLIFAYSLLDGKLKIKQIWLKKIWEITGASQKRAVKVQEKRSVIYNIRPVSWMSERAVYKPFKNKEDFILALNETLKLYEKTKINKALWLKEVVDNYFEHTGERLSIDVNSLSDSNSESVELLVDNEPLELDEQLNSFDSDNSKSENE